MRSQGPIQRIAVSPIASQLSTSSTLNLGTVQLPLSGNGQFPTVTGTVTMGNNTLLSGFAINPNGVEAVGVQNVIIDQNQITNADNGIRLQDVTGTVEVTNNTISQTTDDGIDLGLDNTNLNSVLISGNMVRNTGDEGIDVDVYNNSQLNSVTISGNTVSDAGAEADGINLYVADNSQVNTATISGNRVSNVSNTGIDVYVYYNSQIDSVTITDNTVTTSENDADGIFVLAADDGTINTANITGNMISTTGSNAEGIFVLPFNNSSITTANISNNLIPQAGRDSVRVDNNGGNPICTVISGNRSDNPGFATANGRDFNLISNGNPFQTGDIDIHEMAWAKEELWVVNTRFSCLCTLDNAYSFVPRWRPPFITGLAAEDRCHLNGLAVVDHQPKYVTALGTTNTAQGWRPDKASGGILMDVVTNEVLCQGLLMPHSPRWYAGKLWVLESGNGSVATVDLNTGQLTTVAELPGFTRGLDFYGPLAFVGLSQVRESAVFSGIPLTNRLKERTCGVWVIHIHTGEIVGFLRFEDAVQEIFAVAVLPQVGFPEILEGDEKTLASSYALPDQVLAEVEANGLKRMAK